MTDDADVLSANAAFYDAFRVESLAAMDSVWARRAKVACVPPGWPALIGRDQVMASWRAIFESGTPAIRCAEAEAHVLGDAAFVTCTELLNGGTLVATNLFVREDGAWRMVHHHAGPVAAPEAETDPKPPSQELN
jgi:ketosteroid isomerase-like protein